MPAGRVQDHWLQGIAEALRAPIRRCAVWSLSALLWVSANAWLMSAAGPAIAQEANVIRLASLEWPPYSGETLKQQGAAAAVIRAAFAAVGYRVEIEYFPWARAVRLVRDDSNQYQGYFPEYWDPSNSDDFIYSPSIGTGPLGFAENRTNPVTWTTLDDLQKYKIGTVHGYFNTPTFDERVRLGQIKADVAPSDLSNLLKLEAGRVDLAVIDKRVFSFLTRTAAQFAQKRNGLAFNERLLEEKDLFLCFKKSEEGQRLERDFARGLKKINAAAVIANYMKAYRD